MPRPVNFGEPAERGTTGETMLHASRFSVSELIGNPNLDDMELAAEAELERLKALEDIRSHNEWCDEQPPVTDAELVQLQIAKRTAELTAQGFVECVAKHMAEREAGIESVSPFVQSLTKLDKAA